MNNFFKFNLNTVLLVVAIVLFWTDGCDEGINEGTTEGIKTEIVYRDTGTHRIDTVKIAYGTAQKPIIPQNADTAKAFEKFYTPTPFSLHYRDSSVEINHTGLLYENAITQSILDYKNLRPTQLITHVRPDPKRRVSLGLITGYLNEPFLGGLAIYTDRRDRSFLVGYGTGKTLLAGAAFKISFKR